LVAEKAELEREYSRIIHSSRKHGKYIAVNCGAIPEGTIDSELFGQKALYWSNRHS
jgi:transcriptional regulator of acetoin/glycerol metabolism